MKLRLYQVDTFASAVFRGNPAGVCPLDRWLPEATMQSIAAENNVAATAFFVPRGAGPGSRGAGIEYDIRWFTPETEINLCGHATLASGHVILGAPGPARESVTFHSKSGPLTVHRSGDLLALDFPARPPGRCAAPPGLAEMLGVAPREVWMSRDLMAVYDTEDEVRAITPSFDRIRTVEVFGVIATAPGREADFVSRFFAPRQGVPEDPATGSAHCTLVPYWSRRLGRTTLRGLQLSARGGEMHCEDRGERVRIAGRVVQYLEGTIEV
jgi:predicted PhzF superfamily epimerase YddE/YHI9